MSCELALARRGSVTCFSEPNERLIHIKKKLQFLLSASVHILTVDGINSTLWKRRASVSLS